MLQEGFPKEISDDVMKVCGLIPRKTSQTLQDVEYTHGGQLIKFAYRNYYMDIADSYIETLTDQQKMVLHCIYSRNYDGYVRQKHLKWLLSMAYEEWAIPYIVKICDEYVIEIVEMTYNILKDEDTAPFRNFCIENKEELCKSYSRMTSYWNEYYRHRYSDLQQYVGTKLFKECFGYSTLMER